MKGSPTNTVKADAPASKATRHRNRTRNAACTPVQIPGPRFNRKRGYLPTAQRLVVNPDERKGNEKAAEALREYARKAGMYVSDEWSHF